MTDVHPQTDKDHNGDLLENLTFRQGIKDSVPTIIGYLSVSFACGILAASSGFSVLATAVLALMVYAGAGQFIICALVAAGTPISAVVLTIFIVNSRHLLMCGSLAPSFRQYSMMKNISIGLLITDETFGVAMNRIMKKKPLNDIWMFGVNLSAYSSWVAGCVLGAVLGQWIPDPRSLGLDFALSAMFCALLMLQLQYYSGAKLRQYLVLAGIVVFCMFFFSIFFETYIAVLFSTVIGATAGMRVCSDD